MRFMLAPFADKVFGRGKLLAGALTLLCVAAAATPASAQMMRMDAIPLDKIDRNDEPFGRSTNFVPAGPLWIKWRGVDDGFAKDEDAIAHCRAEPGSCSNAAKRMIALIDEAKDLTGRRRLAIVNREINLSIAYTSDMTQFGSVDVWSTPVSTFASGRGDCEDYATAKMFALRAAGVPAEDMRFLVVRLRGGDIHAVLAVRNEGRWIILDNRSMVLVEDKQAHDLFPLFAMDAGGIRQFGAPVITVAARTQQGDVKPAAASAQTPVAAEEPLTLSMWF
jgi:predicted transglutaminase-like cysteine proteinase